ncbi:MAG TPA: hypothetical protein VG944_19275 [Fimbriimonas sp.]|nr:hypothetical protein [Fimbriimonas sp.]
MLKSCVGLEPEMLLDSRLLSLPAVGRAERDYAVVHGHDFSPEFAEKVSSWALGTKTV